MNRRMQYDFLHIKICYRCIYKCVIYIYINISSCHSWQKEIFISIYNIFLYIYTWTWTVSCRTTFYISKYVVDVYKNTLYIYINIASCHSWQKEISIYIYNIFLYNHLTHQKNDNDKKRYWYIYMTYLYLLTHQKNAFLCSPCYPRLFLALLCAVLFESHFPHFRVHAFLFWGFQNLGPSYTNCYVWYQSVISYNLFIFFECS